MSNQAERDGSQERLRVMSYNIRYDTESDGSDAWHHRRDLVVDTIQASEPDLIGVQEALKHQLEYIETTLSKYTWYGVGRDDGQDAGEFVPVGYRTDRFSLLDKGTFWLSRHPDEPGSKDWDAYCPRITTWIALESNDAGTPVTLFNTHFDHRSALARHRSAELLQERAADAITSGSVIVTADINAPESASPYALLAGKDEGDEPVLYDGLHLSETDHQGPQRTYHEFTGIPFERRDYIFVDRSLAIRSYRTIDEREQKRFSSDHFPLIAEVTD